MADVEGIEATEQEEGGALYKGEVGFLEQVTSPLSLIGLKMPDNINLDFRAEYVE